MTLKIGSVKIENAIVLAPMCGVTDLPFRRLVKELGIGLVVTEMIASRAMVYQSKKTLKMSSVCEVEKPMSVQLAGCEPDIMAEAAKLNEDRGAAIIDINMGCPVKKITNGDAGSALMRDESLAAKILTSVVNAVKIPVTLKIRMGWDETSLNAPVIARIAEDCGIQALAVHGRTRCQFFKGQADWNFIKKVVAAVKIPVFGNGDIKTVDDAQEMLSQSQTAGALIGRGTYGRPWFPNQVKVFLENGERISEPSIQEQKNIILKHYDSILSHYGTELGVRIARKHLGWYSKCFPDSAQFRAEINVLNAHEKVIHKIHKFYDSISEKKQING